MSDADDPLNLQDVAEDIATYVEANRMRLFELCADLVAARSVNPPGRTVEAAAVLESYLNENGLVCDTLSNIDEKPNVVCETLGHKQGRHLIFNGHLDTVSPGREQDWSVPLYETTIADDKMTGLGMGNMKAAVAALSLAFVWLAKNPRFWPGKISYAAVADETVFGPDGAGWLLNQRPDLKGDAVICGEGPGGMNLAIAEKGLLWIELSATAPSGQGMLATPSGSAVSRLARAIARIDTWNDIQIEPPAELILVKPYAGEHGLRLSVNSGNISGGQFISQVATEAKAEIDFRVPPGMTTRDVEERLDTLCRDIDGLSFQRIKGWEPNWTSADQRIVCSISTAARLVRGRKQQSCCQASRQRRQQVAGTRHPGHLLRPATLAGLRRR